MVHVKLMPLCACVPLIRGGGYGACKYLNVQVWVCKIHSLCTTCYMSLCQHTVMIIIIPHWFVGDMLFCTYIQVETTLLVRENLKQINFDIIVEYYNYRAFLLTLLQLYNIFPPECFMSFRFSLLYILAMDHA